MSQSFDVRPVGVGRLRAVLESMPFTLKQYVLDGMGIIGRGLVRHIKVEKLRGQALNARTGNLSRAIFSEVLEDGDDVLVSVGADLAKAKYARVQELGGTIKPKNAKHLTIPIGEAQTRNGVARFTARDVIANPGSFGYTGTFTKNKIIFGKRDDGSASPLFVLKDSVTLKAVGYLSSTVEEKQQWARAELAKAIARGLRALKLTSKDV